MARSVIRQSRRIIICRSHFWRIAKIYRVLDSYFVILNLTVSGLAGGLIYGGRRAAEAGVSRAGYGRGRDREGQAVGSGRKIRAVEDSLVALLPVAVAIEVDPGTQRTGHAGRHDDVARSADVEWVGETHSILVIVVGTSAVDHESYIAIIAIGSW